MKKKLKKKIWIISSVILLTYIAAIILNPTAWIALLPIIIPAGILTIGLPAYSIIRNTKETLEKTTNKQETNSKQTSDIQKNKRKTTKTDLNTDLIDDIVNDNSLTSEEKKRMLETLKTEYEQNKQDIKDPQKIK